MSDPAPAGRAYAYHVPLDPYDPRDGQWATLVRIERVRVGDRIDVAVHETVSGSDGSCPEVVVSGLSTSGKVTVIEAAEDDGRRAGVRGWRGAAVPIWDGTLVLRRIE